MESLSTSLILLLVAILLLWLAVTDKLSRVLDAWDYVIGKTNSLGGNTVAGISLPSINLPVSLSLPSLPTFGSNAQVGV